MTHINEPAYQWFLIVNMVTTEKKTKKRNFSDLEVELLVGEGEVRRDIFGGHSSGGDK